MVDESKGTQRTVGSRLKQWRQESGITLKDLGEALNCSENYLSAVENDYEGFKLRWVEILGLKFNVDLNWLITGEPKKD